MTSCETSLLGQLSRVAPGYSAFGIRRARLFNYYILHVCQIPSDSYNRINNENCGLFPIMQAKILLIVVLSLCAARMEASILQPLTEVLVYLPVI